MPSITAELMDMTVSQADKKERPDQSIRILKMGSLDFNHTIIQDADFMLMIFFSGLPLMTQQESIFG